MLYVIALQRALGMRWLILLVSASQVSVLKRPIYCWPVEVEPCGDEHL